MKIALHSFGDNRTLYVGDWNVAAAESQDSHLAILSIISADWPLLPVANAPRMRITADDSRSELIIQHFDAAAEFIHGCLMDDNRSVLVHCQAGRSRSVTFCAAYISKYCGKQMGEAIEHIKTFHPAAG
jgi:dual specificity phosphatase 12